LNDQNEREDIDPCNFEFSKEEKLDIAGSETGFWNTQTQHINIPWVHFFESSREEIRMMIEELEGSRIYTDEAGRDT
jgi:hypothetical protein